VDVLRQQASAVLDVLSRVQKVFGGDCAPAAPPAFAPPRDLEKDVGRGAFADLTATAPGREMP
jgi:hypothetical protein